MCSYNVWPTYPSSPSSWFSEKWEEIFTNSSLPFKILPFFPLNHDCFWETWKFFWVVIFCQRWDLPSTNWNRPERPVLSFIQFQKNNNPRNNVKKNICFKWRQKNLRVHKDKQPGFFVFFDSSWVFIWQNFAFESLRVGLILLPNRWEIIPWRLTFAPENRPGP